MSDSFNSAVTTTCCIVGGGPAGMMAGLLFARAGIDVIVIEKHADFFRDFRGDTVHPSTLQIMDDLDILHEFLKRPHFEVRDLGAQIGDKFIQLADFSFLPTKCKFIALMPQWDFLDFLVGQARRYKGFRLMMKTEAVNLIYSNEKISGIVAKTEHGEIRIHADLVIAADGRHSLMRTEAGLSVEEIGAPMDVLWMRLSKVSSDPPQTLGRITSGAMFVMLNRNDYWQCGYVIAKGALEKLKAEGIESFRTRIVTVAPFLAGRVHELASWDDIKLLTVQVDRLKKWYRDGLLCIGDAAHAMSPVGGVGINLAIQDAVATANLLWHPLSTHTCSEEQLHRVQLRRTYPTVMTQKMQVIIQNKVVSPALSSKAPIQMPAAMQLFKLLPILRAIPATTVGMGFRPEHVRSPSVTLV